MVLLAGLFVSLSILSFDFIGGLKLDVSQTRATLLEKDLHEKLLLAKSLYTGWQGKAPDDIADFVATQPQYRQPEHTFVMPKCRQTGKEPCHLEPDTSQPGKHWLYCKFTDKRPHSFYTLRGGKLQFAMTTSREPKPTTVTNDL